MFCLAVVLLLHPWRPPPYPQPACSLEPRCPTLRWSPTTSSPQASRSNRGSAAPRSSL